MGILRNLFGGGNDELLAYLERGAVVLDVRTSEEYRGGHVNVSKNIPLQSLESNLTTVTNWKKPVIVCCASGMRSGQAQRFLKSKDVDCINGGSWIRVNSEILKTH